MDSNFNQYLNNGSISVSGYLLTHYHDLGLDADELVILLELKLFRSHGNLFPNAQVISDATEFSQKEVTDLLHELISKNFISFSKSHEGFDEYSFDALNVKIANLLAGKDINDFNSLQTDTTDASVADRKTVFKKIENEFGRPLSSIEIETINNWVDEDHYSPELIDLALKEAVLSQVYNLKYIDKILLNWQHKNITTASQVEEANKRRQDSFNTNKNSYNEQGPTIPMFKIDK